MSSNNTITVVRPDQGYVHTFISVLEKNIEQSLKDHFAALGNMVGHKFRDRKTREIIKKIVKKINSGRNNIIIESTINGEHVSHIILCNNIAFSLPSESTLEIAHKVLNDVKTVPGRTFFDQAINMEQFTKNLLGQG